MADAPDVASCDKLNAMNIPTQPNIKLVNAGDYRENYANSVQVRVNVWDFFLVFGTLQQQNEAQVEVKNFQGIYLSPQQAKALMSILQQNVAGYESAFGEIKLDPRMAAAGPIH
jgi:flagellar protein FlaG